MIILAIVNQSRMSHNHVIFVFSNKKDMVSTGEASYPPEDTTVFIAVN